MASTQQTAPSQAPRGGAQALADRLVIFGVTGDLAKVMTFHSLYRLEKRKLLDCPIIGVAGDDWSVEQLRERAREQHRRLRRNDRRGRVRAVCRAALLRIGRLRQ